MMQPLGWVILHSDFVREEIDMLGAQAPRASSADGPAPAPDPAHTLIDYEPVVANIDPPLLDGVTDVYGAQVGPRREHEGGCTRRDVPACDT